MFTRFILGFLLCARRMTVTGICSIWPDGERLANYYAFLGRSPWSINLVAQVLFTLIVDYILPLQEPSDRVRLVILGDSTFIGKSGKKMEGAGKYYNSNAGVTGYGHELVRLSIVVKIQDKGVFELPFFSRLYVRKKDIDRHSLELEYQSREILLPSMVRMVKNWTNLPIILVADSLYSGQETLRELKDSGIGLISRRQNTEKKSAVGWDADRVSPPACGKIKTEKGKIWFNNVNPEEFEEFDYISGTKTMTVKAKRYGRVYLHQYSNPVSVVVVQGSKGEKIVLVSTCLSLSTIDIILLYRYRFRIEFGFRDTKQFTGLEDYQVRRIKGVERHLFLSQVSYCLAKMAFILDDEMRSKCLELFYMKRRIRLPTFSMMRMKEELQLLFKKPNKGKPQDLPGFPLNDNLAALFESKKAARKKIRGEVLKL